MKRVLMTTTSRVALMMSMADASAKAMREDPVFQKQQHQIRLANVKAIIASNPNFKVS